MSEKVAVSHSGHSPCPGCFEREAHLSSELALLRRAVKQLGAERTTLAALVVALDSDYTDMLSRETQTTFQKALDTAEPDTDVLELIKEQERETI